MHLAQGKIDCWKRTSALGPRICSTALVDRLNKPQSNNVVIVGGQSIGYLGSDLLKEADRRMLGSGGALKERDSQISPEEIVASRAKGGSDVIGSLNRRSADMDHRTYRHLVGLLRVERAP